MAFTYVDPHSFPEPSVEAAARARVDDDSVSQAVRNDRRDRQRTVKAVAVTCIVAVGAFATLMATSPAAREAIASWGTMGETSQDEGAAAPAVDHVDELRPIAVVSPEPELVPPAIEATPAPAAAVVAAVEPPPRALPRPRPPIAAEPRPLAAPVSAPEDPYAGIAVDPSLAKIPERERAADFYDDAR